jgi:zinc protease
MEEAIYQELDRLKEVPPREEELRRLKNQMEAGEVRGLRSNFGLAMQLALSASLFDDWKALFRFDERLLDVTPEDIQRVVRGYFTPSNRTVATLVNVPAETEEVHR